MRNECARNLQGCAGLIILRLYIACHLHICVAPSPYSAAVQPILSVVQRQASARIARTCAGRHHWHLTASRPQRLCIDIMHYRQSDGRPAGPPQALGHTLAHGACVRAEGECSRWNGSVAVMCSGQYGDARQAHRSRPAD